MCSTGLVAILKSLEARWSCLTACHTLLWTWITFAKCKTSAFIQRSQELSFLYLGLIILLMKDFLHSYDDTQNILVGKKKSRKILRCIESQSSILLMYEPCLQSQVQLCWGTGDNYLYLKTCSVGHPAVPSYISTYVWTTVDYLRKMLKGIAQVLIGAALARNT